MNVLIAIKQGNLTFIITINCFFTINSGNFFCIYSFLDYICTMIKENNYIQTITKSFLEIGIKSVSMDDISKKLGISKKTLYQIYKDKTDIVEKAIEFIKEQWIKVSEEYDNTELNVIEQEIEHRRKYLTIIQRFTPTFLFDLKKFYPEIYNEFIEFKKEITYKTSIKCVKQGIEQGLYRDDLDPEFIAKFTVTMSNATFNEDVSSFTHSEILGNKYAKDFYKYHLYGICSDKGRALFDKLSAEL